MLMKQDATVATPRFNRGLCTACTMCVDACPTTALDIKVMNSVNGFRRFPYLRYEKECLGCRICEKECPFDVIAIG